MKHKFTFLICIAAAVVVALCIIQFYLVRTTYEYKVAQFRMEIKEKLEKTTQNFNDLDTILLSKKELFYQQIAQNYLLDKKYRWQLKKQWIQNDFKEEITKRLEKSLRADFPDDSLHFAVITSKLVLVGKNSADTIFSEKPSLQTKLFGNLENLDDAFLVRNYLNTSSVSDTKSEYKLIVEDNLYVSIANWQTLILKRMTLVLVFAIGSILVVISIFIITLKVAMQQKKLSDIKTDFINNITHELKTPLTTLAISTKILERKEMVQNEVVFSQVLQTISRQNSHLQKLIDQVLTNSIGKEDIQLQKQKTKISVLLQNVIEDFTIANPKIIIETNFKDEEFILELDPFLLTTAVINMLENAVKYGSKTIFISTNTDNNQYHIGIKDDGLGISKNNQSLLFDKFYRVNQGNVHNVKGLGLGLYYVNQIIKAHKGSVDLISDLGKGSLFTLSIPSNI